MPAFPVPEADVIPYPIVVSVDGFDFLDAPLANKLAGSPVNS